MSEQENKTAETVVEATQPVEAQKKPEIVVPIDENTAFTIKIQEFDKEIAVAEMKVYELKAQRANFIYSSNVEKLARNHQENMLRQQTEEEIKAKMKTAQADAKA